MVYNAAARRLDYDLSELPFGVGARELTGVTITQIIDESDHTKILDRHYIPSVRTRGVTARLRQEAERAITHGDYDFPFDQVFPLGGRRGTMLAWDDNVYIGAGVYTIRYGPYLITRAEAGARLLLDPRQQTAWRARARAALRGLRDNDPMHLPFRNVLLNDGPEDACVERFLGVQLQPWARNCAGIIAHCEHIQMVCTIYDVYGGTYARTDPRMTPSDAWPDPISAVMFADHIYPVIGGGPPLLIADPRVSTDEPLVPMMERAERLQRHLFYSRNNTYYVAVNPSNNPCAVLTTGAARTDAVIPGVHSTEGMTEEWMDEFFGILPQYAMYPDVMEVLKLGVQALFKDDMDPADYGSCVAIDMTKCYFNTTLQLAEAGRLWHLDVFSMFGERSPTEEIVDDWLYILPARWATGGALDSVGLRSTLVSGEMLFWLRRWLPGRLEGPYTRLRTTPLPLVIQRQFADELRKLDPQQQKDYAIVNGCFGKVYRDESWWLGGRTCSKEERDYYNAKYGMVSNEDGLMSSVRRTTCVRSRFYMYCNTVMAANAQVMKTALIVSEHTGRLPPYKIKVDSLFYPAAQARRLAANVPEGWHLVENTEPPLVACTPMPMRFVEPRLPFPTEWNNTTFVGPPGTGKTFTGMQLPFDIACCFSHKGARRVNGRTVHSVFNLWNRDSMEKVRDKVIFVDEAQMCSRMHWGMFIHAYLNCNTRFIFAMDPNQLPPVNEDPVPHTHPFYGYVRVLTHDFRNDAAIIRMRDAVLAGTFNWREQQQRPPECVMLVNICFTNGMRYAVNKWVLDALGKHHGDAGVPYIAKEANWSRGWLKNQMFTYDGFVMREVETGATIIMIMEDVIKHFDPMYCTTVHKRIGEEIIADEICIWEADKFDKHMMYTAITRGRRADQLYFSSTLSESE